MDTIELFFEVLGAFANPYSVVLRELSPHPLFLRTYVWVLFIGFAIIGVGMILFFVERVGTDYVGLIRYFDESSLMALGIAVLSMCMVLTCISANQFSVAQETRRVYWYKQLMPFLVGASMMEASGAFSLGRWAAEHWRIALPLCGLAFICSFLLAALGTVALVLTSLLILLAYAAFFARAMLKLLVRSAESSLASSLLLAVGGSIVAAVASLSEPGAGLSYSTGDWLITLQRMILDTLSAALVMGLFVGILRNLVGS